MPDSPLVRYAYGPKAKDPSRKHDWKTKIVSTPVHDFYEMEPSIPVKAEGGAASGELAYLLGEPCDGWVHDVYQPVEEPGDGSLIGQALTYGDAVQLAKAWHVSAQRAQAEAKAAAREVQTIEASEVGELDIAELLDLPAGAIAVEIAPPDAEPEQPTDQPAAEQLEQPAE